MKFILTPIDFSGATPRVVNAAVKLARALRAHVVLLHVVSGPRSQGVTAESGDRAEMTNALREAAERQLLEAKADLLRRGITAHALCLTGSPAADIVDHAYKLDAECIVMGAHGHTGLRDLVAGTTVSAVMKRAPCPVMIVPDGAPRGRNTPALAKRLYHALKQ